MVKKKELITALGNITVISNNYDDSAERWCTLQNKQTGKWECFCFINYMNSKFYLSESTYVFTNFHNSEKSELKFYEIRFYRSEYSINEITNILSENFSTNPPFESKFRTKEERQNYINSYLSNGYTQELYLVTEYEKSEFDKLMIMTKNTLPFELTNLKEPIEVVHQSEKHELIGKYVQKIVIPSRDEVHIQLNDKSEIVIETNDHLSWAGSPNIMVNEKFLVIEKDQGYFDVFPKLIGYSIINVEVFLDFGLAIQFQGDISFFWPIYINEIHFIPIIPNLVFFEGKTGVGYWNISSKIL